MDTSIEKLEREFMETRKFRDNYGKYVGYHRIELERITNKWLEVKEKAGEHPTIPQAVKTYANNYDWKEMFLP